MKFFITTLMVGFLSSFITSDIYSCESDTLLTQHRAFDSLLSGEKVFIRSDNDHYLELSLKNIHQIFALREKRWAYIESRGKATGDSIPYYTFNRYLDLKKDKQLPFENIGYAWKTIGVSLKGRPIDVILPKEIKEDKTTLLFFARQHGNESSHNWILEGILEQLLDRSDFLERFQLIIYPFINPDGAIAKSRYNSKSRDLNRSWGVSSSKSRDEAQTVHRHLEEIDWRELSIPIVLDLHGSFREDFIFRTSKSFTPPLLYKAQSEFIETLGSYDLFQNGRFKTSNGDPKMARIIFVKKFGLNALTHETPRTIKFNSPYRRSMEELTSQGDAILDTIGLLY